MRSAYLRRQAAGRRRARPARAAGVAGLIGAVSLAMYLTGFLPPGRGPVNQAKAAASDATSLARALAGKRAAFVPVPGGNFGHSVSVAGTTAVVGVPDANGGQGAVFVFGKVGASWKPTAKLNDPNRSDDGDFFGYSVAVSGSTIAVGAPEEANRRGVVYVFGKSRTGWYLQSEIPCPAPRGVEMTFGSSLALGGETLLIGSPGWSNSTGIAYVYTKPHSRWYRAARLTLPRGIGGDNFGYSVALANNTILIGAPGRTYGSGSVYVFGRHGRTAWGLMRGLGDPGKAQPSDSFGFAVSLTGSTAIISAPGRSGSRGAAYIYRHSGPGGWHEMTEVTDPRPVLGDNFGSSVSITSRAAVIGASFKNGGRGEAFIVRYYATKRHRYAWHQTLRYYDPGRAAGDLFGSSVSVSGGITVVGADGTNNSAGEAYVFAKSRRALGAHPAVESASVPAAAWAIDQSARAHWQLRLNSGFGRTRLNTRIWKSCFPWTRRGAGCTNFGNTQFQWYLPSQIHVAHGVLSLVAKAERTNGQNKKKKPKVYNCRSGMVTTTGFSFTYGVVKVVAKMSGSKGMWPALWLAASNLQWPPEVDMVEHWFMYQRPTAVFLHPRGGHRAAAWPVTSNLGIGWHTYTLVWTSTSMTFFIDGQVWLVTHLDVPHQQMYFIADLADEGNPGYGRCSGTLALHSLKVWQLTTR